MNLQEQVCTLEQAKKLKELGIKQKSLFYFHSAFNKPVFGETKLGFEYTPADQVCNDKKNACSAFTVAELGELLPTGYATVKTGLFHAAHKESYFTFTCIKGAQFKDKEDYNYEHPNPREFMYMNDFDNPLKSEAEARAAMLIYLLENKLV